MQAALDLQDAAFAIGNAMVIIRTTAPNPSARVQSAVNLPRSVSPTASSVVTGPSAASAVVNTSPQPLVAHGAPVQGGSFDRTDTASMSKPLPASVISPPDLSSDSSNEVVWTKAFEPFESGNRLTLDIEAPEEGQLASDIAQANTNTIDDIEEDEKGVTLTLSFGAKDIKDNDDECAGEPESGMGWDYEGSGKDFRPKAGTTTVEGTAQSTGAEAFFNDEEAPVARSKRLRYVSDTDETKLARTNYLARVFLARTQALYCSKT